MFVPEILSSVKDNASPIAEIEIIPAILVKKKEELIHRINIVKPYVQSVHIDVMDGKFVPNTTLAIEDLRELPDNISYEFHLMVEEPAKWIEKLPQNQLHLVHLETIKNLFKIKEAIRSVSGHLGIAFNPETHVEKALPYCNETKRFLVMSVHPGFDGQKYLPGAESKISEIRKHCPNASIGVDGGINIETIGKAVAAGADKLVAASAIYSFPHVKNAIEQLQKAAGKR